ncbi:cytochrome b/b6 domain-containing protein [Actinomadura alba]|uniref:Cytochrome b/b6 domain-containing protein n=1 Tax=Actinomadura alba TaxID=406431 RepID=A0ABR7LK04_9ACTN|nr:cytochrome b/b6 domain-containing protein [Actinomadura alba]MBC6465187.1 cytochrome b/b6 domain-containing protein [Actinomadura alba]
MSRPGPRRQGRRGGRTILRFTRSERAVHHAVALLMIICLVTAACLYVPAIAAAVGRRELIKTIHVIAGFGLPVPILAGRLFAAFRADLRRLNRFRDEDWEWLRRRDRRAVIDGTGAIPVGKFNAGQKLNAAFVAGAVLVMLGTGAMLTFPGPFPDAWRTGATFVHDWLTLAVLVVFLGHLRYALRDRGAMAGMWDGHVDLPWAARHHPAWLSEQAATREPALRERAPREAAPEATEERGVPGP